MANQRDILRRMQSVKATMQITRTMEMVSTAKIRTALERAEEAEPYKNAIAHMLAHVSSSASMGDQPLLQTHDAEKSVLFVIIASDRGLAGGFNVTLCRSVFGQITALEEQGVKVSVICCGRKVVEFFKSLGYTPDLYFEGMSSEPTMDEADRIASYVMDGYVAESFDRVVISYHHAIGRVEQVEVHEQLLPVTTDDLRLPNSPRQGEEGTFQIGRVQDTMYRFDPSAKEVLGYLIPAYVRTVVYHALLDSAASEHAARRQAMQSATDNAQEVITNLSRTYNRVRQGSITTELNEIIGGASALEEDQ